MKKKLGIIGSGRLAGIIVDAYNGGLLEAYEITGIFGRSEAKVQALAEKAGCKACTSLDALLADRPDYVAEAASVAGMKEYACGVLESGAQLVALSIGALADGDFYAKVRQCALENDTKVHLVSGAIGGFDIMRTIMLMGGEDAKAGISMKKPLTVLRGTTLYKDELENHDEEVFRGNAEEAIALLPTQVNVAVSASLATLGPQDTEVVIDSALHMEDDVFDLYAESDLAKVKINIVSAPHISSGWSVVARLQNLESPIVF